MGKEEQHKFKFSERDRLFLCFFVSVRARKLRPVSIHGDLRKHKSSSSFFLPFHEGEIDDLQAL